MLKKFHVILLGFALVYASSFAQKYKWEQNISYYPKSVTKSDKYKEERCKLDIYYPTDSADFVTIVWFHGGGLFEGSKFIAKELRNQNVAIVAVNYRFTPKVNVKDCIDDAAAAVAWTFKNIKKYGGDPSKIIVSGHSAGGYLTSMVGLDKSYLQKYKINANRIAALVPFSGHAITHFTERKMRGIPGGQAIVDSMAPLFHVRPDCPRMVIITGDRDLEILGRYEENAYMWRMMRLVGHKETEIFELEGYGHMMAVPAYPLLLNEAKRISTKPSKQ